MVKLFEKQVPMWNKVYFDENKTVFYKSKLIKPFRIGERRVDLYNKNGTLLGKVVEDATNSTFMRKLYVNEKEIAILEGKSFRESLKLKNLPWHFSENISTLNYSIVDGSNATVFSYEKHWLRKSKLTIFQEEQTIVCLLITLAVPMDCRTGVLKGDITD